MLTKNALLIPFILHTIYVSLERVNSLQHKTPSNIDAGFNIYGDINFKSHSPPKTKPDPKGIWSPRPGLMWHVGLGHRKCPTKEDGGTNIDRKQMCVFCCVYVWWRIVMQRWERKDCIHEVLISRPPFPIARKGLGLEVTLNELPCLLKWSCSAVDSDTDFGL